MPECKNRSNTWMLCAALAGAAWLGREALRKRREADLSGQVVLITGGSRGLGLLLAREFAAEGCRIVICARDEEELQRATAVLTEQGAQALYIPCDLTSREQVETMVNAVMLHYGHIDILVNNAGIISVGPAQMMQCSDFEQAMNVNFYGVLNTTWAVLPSMRRRRQGRIVNISSVGGRVAVPHLLPYSCSKFAVTALSEGLRAELRRDNIQVTTILPGTMRTGSHYQAQVKGREEDEFANFSLSATLPLLSQSAEIAARRIVTATKRGESERVLSFPAQMMTTLHGLCPGATADLLGYINQYVLPDPGGTGVRTQGKEIARRIHSPLFPLLTYLGKRAAKRLNQLTPS